MDNLRFYDSISDFIKIPKNHSEVVWNQWGIGYPTESCNTYAGSSVCQSIKLTHRSRGVLGGAVLTPQVHSNLETVGRNAGWRQVQFRLGLNYVYVNAHDAWVLEEC